MAPTVRAVVVGGGVTGLGVAWDLTLRGVQCTVIDSRAMGNGTSGRFHGLLHSGARYVLADERAAQQCAAENAVLRRLASDSVEATGGFMVGLDGEDEAVWDRWAEAAARLGVAATEVSPDRARALESALSARTARVYATEDARIDSFHLLRDLAAAIAGHGGEILYGTRATAVRAEGGRVRAVVALSEARGTIELAADVAVVAAGPWAGEVLAAFGIPLALHLYRGAHVIVANRLSRRVLHRLGPPGDGDILVPHDLVSILGTTSVLTESPSDTRVEAWEVERLVRLGSELVPALPRMRLLRAFAGVRPIYDPVVAFGAAGHSLSRDFTVVDHGARDGMAGLFSVLGGKLTTFRLMAAAAADAAVAYAGRSERRSRTAEIPIVPGGAARPGHEVAHGSDARVPDTAVVCECEGVTFGRWRQAAPDRVAQRRLTTWAGMGPCQGTFCGPRLAAERVAEGATPETGLSELVELRRERLRGMAPVAWGEGLRQALMMRAVDASLGLGWPAAAPSAGRDA